MDKMRALSQKIRSILGDIKFRNELKTLKRVHHQTVNFEEAQKIGLLYDATDPKNYEVVKNYVKKVRGLHKDVLALGYVDKKELPHNQYAQYGLDFFCRKNLDFKMTPNHHVVSNFINEKFDILIHLNGRKVFPLRYIAALSHAKFRVGKYDRRNFFLYDLMISIKEGSTMNQFIEEAERYLKLIKK